MLTETVFQALVEQFNHERANQVLYQAFADYMEAATWPGFSHWFDKQAEEEGQHARRIAAYLIDQNCLPVYMPLEAPPMEGIDTAPEVLFKLTLERERLTTSMINQLYHLADLEESPATCEFLLWFIREQVEEERALVDILQEMGRATCPAALLLLDREYKNR